MHRDHGRMLSTAHVSGFGIVVVVDGLKLRQVRERLPRVELFKDRLADANSGGAQPRRVLKLAHR